MITDRELVLAMTTTTVPPVFSMIAWQLHGTWRLNTRRSDLRVPSKHDSDRTYDVTRQNPNICPVR